MRSQLCLIAVALVLAGCGNGGSGPDDESLSSATASASDSPAEPDACQEAVEEWLVVYDALREATMLNDPTEEMVQRAIDNTKPVRRDITAECDQPVVVAAAEAEYGLARTVATLQACEFVTCGDEVNEEFSKAMRAAEVVRAQESVK